MGISALRVTIIALALVALAALSYRVYMDKGLSLANFAAPRPSGSPVNQLNPSRVVFQGQPNNSNYSNFSVVFRTLNGTLEKWNFTAATYGEYASKPKFTPVLLLSDAVNGNTLSTYDYSGLITPDLFANDIGSLTTNRTARQFVSEVFNFREQMTAYSLAFGNSSEYPIVILASGEGDCKDSAVLMASMLEEGNIQAGYGMHIQFLYMDYPNVTAPNTINHLILNIIYKNGTSQLLESTGDVEDPYNSVNGWYLNLTCNSSSCEPLTACAAGTVLGADGICHAECGNSGSYCSSGSSCYDNHCVSCQNGYTLGTDGVCHADCGSLSVYCSSGSSCYQGSCISCPAGSIIGNDGSCHQECGTGYCSSGSYCSENRCVSCPSGYHLQGNECYKNQTVEGNNSG